VVVVELQAFGLDVDSVVNQAQELANSGACAISVPEHAFGKLQVSSVALSHLIQEKTGLPAIAHVTAGHRNLFGIQGELMGAHALGIRHLLTLTGDPIRPDATRVKDLRNSVELIRLVRSLNEGNSYWGKPLGGNTNYKLWAAFNPNVANLDAEVARLERKLDAGRDHVQFVASQLIFEPARIRATQRAMRRLQLRACVGLFPVLTMASARFIHENVVTLSSETLSRLSAAEGDPQKSNVIGIRICKQLIDVALDEGAFGIYLVNPRRDLNVSPQLIEYIFERSGRPGATSVEAVSSTPWVNNRRSHELCVQHRSQV
jgi:homocysteine S-methyltransferase